ncbi:winged helix-turn-helix transcriptional regulator [Alloalcanivorax balearicus]|nr:helix-turn-helix domain-containing protein [Alloalcanivorax balearicus]
MKWDDVGNQACSVARTMAVIGDRWTMLILRNAFMGTRRFDHFQLQLSVTRHVLSERLKRLVDAGIFRKEAYKPNRYEYRLTQMGRDLYPVLLAVTAWGDTWLDEGRGAPLVFQHKGCGEMMTPTLVCSECGEKVTASDVIPMAGPGLQALPGSK